MTLLLDTPTLLWWLGGAPLRDEAREQIADPDVVVLVSAASIWEAAIKVSLGKLRVPGSLEGAARDAGFDTLPVTAEHAEAAGALPAHHRDPFDRMLVAQAAIERAALVTRDPVFDAYEVPVLRC